MSKSFFSFNALLSLRSSGYRNTSYAIAELIDNSFDAEAKNIKVIFIETIGSDGNKYIDEILTCDDGKGMNDDVLEECLQFGNTQNIDLENIIKKKTKGKFGFGLPNASISQCRNVQVYSKTIESSYRKTYLDLDELKINNSIMIPSLIQELPPNHFNEIGAILDSEKGTIISWKNFDRLSKSRAKTLIEKSIPIFGRLYRYLLTGKYKITLESWFYNQQSRRYIKESNENIKPNDPLFLVPNAYVGDKLLNDSNKIGTVYAEYFKKFIDNKNKCLPTNEKLEDQSCLHEFSWKGKTYKFTITTSIAKIDIQKPGIREPGNLTETGRFYGEKMNEFGNISFVRAEREIASGHFGFYKPTAPNLRWITIEVTFNPDADELLGVHNNKQSIEFIKSKDIDAEVKWDPYVATYQQAREKLWYDLSTKIQSFWNDAYKIIRKRATDWDANNIKPDDGDEGLPGATSTTIQTIIDVEGEKTSNFTDEDKVELLKRLKEKYPEVPEKDIIKSINKYDASKVRGCVLYNSSESKDLWSYTNVGNFLIVLINTNHDFYLNIMAPFKNVHFENALSAIELFITSLAWEEYHHFSLDEKQKNTIELYRNYVGLHLQRYIKENDIRINEDDLPTSILSNEDIEND